MKLARDLAQANCISLEWIILYIWKTSNKKFACKFVPAITSLKRIAIRSSQLFINNLLHPSTSKMGLPHILQLVYIYNISCLSKLSCKMSFYALDKVFVISILKFLFKTLYVYHQLVILQDCHSSRHSNTPCFISCLECCYSGKHYKSRSGLRWNHGPHTTTAIYQRSCWSKTWNILIFESNIKRWAILSDDVFFWFHLYNLQPIIQLFSLLAIATSYIGFVLGLADFLADCKWPPLLPFWLN